MKHQLLLFLQGETTASLAACSEDALELYKGALVDVEYLLDDPRHARKTEKAGLLFENTYKLITGRSAEENNKEPFWAFMLIDSALLQALEHMTLNVDNAKTLTVLNSLDYATIIGSAYGERLWWIHQAVEYIEGTSKWLQNANLYKLANMVSQKPQSCCDIACSVQTFNVADIDVLRFQQMIADADTACPFIIKGAISHWPALNDHSWSNLAYLQQAVGSHRLVPVELGTKYTDKDWTQKIIPFGEFLGQTASLNEMGVCRYMAQHNLLDQASKLKSDFIIPDYAFVETGRRLAPNDQTASTDGIVVNVWLGPQGTVSPLHFDNYDNLFAQVAGYKYFCLYPPDEAPNLYPYPSGSHIPNTSQVDIESVDLNKHPRFAKASPIECVVEPGDLLYIPVGIDLQHALCGQF